MEAVPRLPMISFELKVSTEPATFGAKIKPYISSFYHENGESYATEVHNLETLRAAAVRPTIDISGCQALKKYYCQLHFLKSRFPMEDGQAAAIYFSWRDSYSNMACSLPEIEFELMNILYNIGALHSKLGSMDSRVTPEGMKMACTHLQCAAWAFQAVRETYPQIVSLVMAPDILHLMHLVSLAQAQECILEKSMMDNRKAAIIAKVAVQVVEYYKQALNALQGGEEGGLNECLVSRTYLSWTKYLSFKLSYHKSIALLYQGQHAEEQRKMGERVAFYQAASDQLQDARKKSSNLNNQQEILEALAFTGDVVEGKRKAAKNENEFIYHEDVPERDALEEVKGASLVRGIPFNVNDAEVSGPDIFARLVPMEAHEASSLYSEQKAQLLRRFGEMVEAKDRELVEFMSSLQLDVLAQMSDTSGVSGLTHDIVDRAAAMTAKPNAIKDLVKTMGRLSNTFHDVESMLNDIDDLLKEEEKKEEDYQKQMGARPPGIIATDLTRETAKYREAHNKANESNQNLHRAVTTHVANLEILCMPLAQLQHQIPGLELSNNPNINEEAVDYLQNMLKKVDEMRGQRSQLWSQFREAVTADDITQLVVTKQPEQSLEDLFQKEIKKHHMQAALIEQNLTAQANILKAIVDAYANFNPTRRYVQEVISKRAAVIAALVNSYDTYDDLLAKAGKGQEFYDKLEANVTKLLQRIKSTCKVQDEEREQVLAKHNKKVVPAKLSSGPKLKDYLNAAKAEEASGVNQIVGAYHSAIGAATVTDQSWPPAVRPAPVGSEMTADAQIVAPIQDGERHGYAGYMASDGINASRNAGAYGNYGIGGYNESSDKTTDQALAERMAALMAKPTIGAENQQYNYQNYQANQTNSSVYHQTPRSAYYNPNSEHLNSPYPNTSLPYQPNSGNFYQTNQTPTPYPPDPNIYKSGYPEASYQQPSSSYSSNPATTNPYQPISGNPYQATVNPYDFQASERLAYPTSSYQQYSGIGTQAVPYGQQNQSYSYQEPQPQVATTYVPNHATNTPQLQPDVNPQFPTYLPNPAISPTQDPSFQSHYSTPQLQQDANSQFENYAYNYPIPSPSPHASEYYPQNVHPSQPISYGSAIYSTPFSTDQISTQTFQVSAQNYVSESQPPTSVYDTTGGYYSYYGSQNGSYGQYGHAYACSPSSAANNTTVVNSFVGNVPVCSPQTQVVQAQPELTQTESNIDLLSGLDFTISQAPLVPQQQQQPQPDQPAKETPPQLQAPPATEPPKLTQPTKVVERKRLPPRKDPLLNDEVLQQFVAEVDKFDKFVDILTIKTLSGPTSLDLKWKELQESDQQPKSISVARCYPLKNRYADILPYDSTRVLISSSKDDYINASYVKDVTLHNELSFIVTQAPMQSTLADFWSMVFEQEIEFIICMVNNNELDENEIYWPKEKESSATFGVFSISLLKQVTKDHWTKRSLSISRLDQRSARQVTHFQFTAWPKNLLPSTPSSFVQFVEEIMGEESLKSSTTPVLVHCLSGIGRSGLVCLLLALAEETAYNPVPLPDLLSAAHKVCSFCKNALRDREHLQFAYRAFSELVKHCVNNRTNKGKPIEEAEESSKITMVSVNDPFSGIDPMWATKRGN